MSAGFAVGEKALSLIHAALHTSIGTGKKIRGVQVIGDKRFVTLFDIAPLVWNFYYLDV
jgi:hypothetical protein